MKTGKCIFGFVFIVLVAVSLSGCSLLFHAILHPAGTLTMDPNLPVEEAAVVVFGEAIYVKEYNGIDVEKAWYPKDRTREMTITVPAGEAHLLFDIYASWSRGNTTYSFKPKDMELKFDFEAGKEYTVDVYASRNIGNFLFPKQKVLLEIRDRKGKNELKSWEIGEF